MQYNWIVAQLLPEEVIGEKQLRKRTIILDEDSDSQYKGWLAVDFFNDKIDMIASLKTWQKVTVYLNSKVREYNGRRYNSITGWRIDTDQPWDQWWSSDTWGGGESDEELFPF